MNLVDVGILAVLGLGFLLGWYKGFLTTALSLASYVVSWVAAFAFYGNLASFVMEKAQLGNTLLYFTAGAEKLSDMSVANADISVLTAEKITESVSNLPTPIGNMILENIQNQAFAAQGITTLSDYFNQTIINLSINLICFLIIFFAVKLVCMFVIGLVDAVSRLPVLKQFNQVLGGALGVLQAAVLIAVVFAVVPIAMSVLPLESFYSMIQGSLLGRLFLNGNIIFSVLKSVM
ncbi:MAG: CvpA family protein [Clostridia bacterium]|nr:CvpA family protein [Clostridia bacterium]